MSMPPIFHLYGLNFTPVIKRLKMMLLIGRIKLFHYVILNWKRSRAQQVEQCRKTISSETLNISCPKIFYKPSQKRFSPSNPEVYEILQQNNLCCPLPKLFKLSKGRKKIIFTVQNFGRITERTFFFFDTEVWQFIVAFKLRLI